MSFKVGINTSEKYPVITLQDENTGCKAEIYAFGALLNAFTIIGNSKSI